MLSHDAFDADGGSRRNCDDPESQLSGDISAASEVVRLDQLTPQCDFPPFLTFSQNTFTFSSYSEPSRWISIKVFLDPQVFCVHDSFWMHPMMENTKEASMIRLFWMSSLSILFDPFPLTWNIVGWKRKRFCIPLVMVSKHQVLSLSCFRLLPCQMETGEAYSSLKLFT